MKGYIYLFIAILFEVAGSAFLKTAEGFTNLWPTIFLVICYGLSFTIFVFALKTISLSIGYSIWAGLGTAGAALVGMFLFNEALSGLNMIGLVVIIAGVVIMNMKSKDEVETA